MDTKAGKERKKTLCPLFCVFCVCCAQVKYSRVVPFALLCWMPFRVIGNTTQQHHNNTQELSPSLGSLTTNPRPLHFIQSHQREKIPRVPHISLMDIYRSLVSLLFLSPLFSPLFFSLLHHPSHLGNFLFRHLPIYLSLIDIIVRILSILTNKKKKNLPRDK